MAPQAGSDADAFWVSICQQCLGWCKYTRSAGNWDCIVLNCRWQSYMWYFSLHN